MQETNEQQHAVWDEVIAKVDPWYAKRLRSRQDDEDMRSLELWMEQMAEPRSVWARLKSKIAEFRRRN